jgi:hypothetical protein
LATSALDVPVINTIFDICSFFLPILGLRLLWC